MIKYLIILIGLTALIGSVVPFAQYIYFSFAFRKKPEKLLFSQVV